jgi:hypothetical protein
LRYIFLNFDVFATEAIFYGPAIPPSSKKYIPFYADWSSNFLTELTVANSIQTINSKAGASRQNHHDRFPLKTS